MANLTPSPKMQFLDANGNPLVAGKLYTYVAGTPSTPLATYTDYGAGTPNTNPVILDSRGEASVWLSSAQYKFVLKDSTGATIWTADNINSADGATLAALAASGGSALVGYLPANVGASATTVQAKLRTLINAADFGFLASASSAANKTALQAAITALGTTGGEIKIPWGQYSCDPGITISATQKNITICGEGDAMTYEGGAGTTITFTAGAIGFDLTNATATSANTCIRNLNINGNSVCQTGIKLTGMVLLEYVNVTACTTYGIWLYDFINMTRLSHVSSSYNSGMGIYIGGGAGNSTIMSMDHFVCRRNSIGMKITNIIHAMFTSGVIEANYGEGLVIYKPTGVQCDYLNFENVWTELNNVGNAGLYNVTIDSQTHNYSGGGPTWVTFKECNFTADATTNLIFASCCYGAEFDRCTGGSLGAVTLDTFAYKVGFIDWNGPAYTDVGTKNWSSFSASTSDEWPGMTHDGLNTHALSVKDPINAARAPLVVATTSGVAATVYTIAASTQMRYFYVFVKVVAGTASASDYSAYALIAADNAAGGGPKILHQVNGAKLTITVSGLAIQATQSSGGAQNVAAAVIPVFNFVP